MKRFVFVLMPFDEDFDDIYKLGIKEACKELDMYCERVDEQYYEGSMLERIYNQINKADYIIADMTNKNPNVFYEVGYSHALGKKVILVTQRSDDIPFDMKHYSHIIYGNKILSLKQDIQKRLQWYIQNDCDVEKNNFQIEVYVNGNLINSETSTEILCPIKVCYANKYEGKIDVCIKNIANTLFMAGENISILAQSDLPLDGDTYENRILPNNKKLLMHSFGGYPIYPGQFRCTTFVISFSDKVLDNALNKIFSFELHFYFGYEIIKYYAELRLVLK